MIGKISKGSSGRALIRYLFGPGRANEHTDQRVVASGLSIGVEEGRPLTPAEIAGLGRAIDAANDRFRANPPGGHIWHVSLSVPQAERPIGDDEWVDMAQRVMSALGFEAPGVQPAAWVAIGHGTSAGGNQHIHIAASLVRMDGRQVNIWQDRKTLSRVCAEFEADYGLSVVEGREGRGMPGLSRAELERSAQGAEPPRMSLARLVREASVASQDEAEFVRRLRLSGALVRPRFETGGQIDVVGYSVAARAEGTSAPVWFGGGKLAKDLTLPKLRQLWGASRENRRAAVAEWSAAKAVAPGREAIVGRPADWQRALTAMDKTLERLRSVPAFDLAAWHGAAREAAGLFAAWSRRVEGDNPGPLAASANALARSAQYRADEGAPNRDAVRDLRGIAAIVAQSQLNTDSPIVWAMMVDQLGRTLRAIGDAHAARGEAEAAKALVERVCGDLDALHDRFEAGSLRELISAERSPEHHVRAVGGTLERQAGHHRRHSPSRNRGVER
jgi:hypothetical protein